MDGGHVFFGSFSEFEKYEAAATSVENAFSEFLDKQINIAVGLRSRASTSHTHLREFLSSEIDRDAGFPRILRIVDQDFLGGSYSRHTKIWPLDDIDIYFPLDGTGLYYTQYGSQMPYDVLSDQVLESNPLLDSTHRWKTGFHISSRKLIDGFAKVLRRHYPSATKVQRVGEAVNVQMVQGGSENSAGFGFDVVPCFSLAPHDPSESPFYLIPDGNDGWIHTNPRIDKEKSDQLQAANEKTFRPAVKLLKWWNLNLCGGRLNSYYIELAAMRRFIDLNQQGQSTATISEAVTVAFEGLKDAVWSGNQESWIPDAPAVEPGIFIQSDRWLLDSDSQKASQALKHESQGSAEVALKIWSEVFGDEFPTAA